jgi:hypothetical protein
MLEGMSRSREGEVAGANAEEKASVRSARNEDMKAARTGCLLINALSEMMGIVGAMETA